MSVLNRFFSKKGMDDNTYKLAGTNTGSSTVQLPSDFNELVIEVYANSNYSNSFQFSVTKDSIPSSGSKTYRTGYYSAQNYYAAVYINVTKTDVHIQELVFNGSNVISASSIAVWYR